MSIRDFQSDTELSNTDTESDSGDSLTSYTNRINPTDLEQNLINPINNLTMAVAPPAIKKEYLDMIPEFHGDNRHLPRFLEICEKLVKKIYNTVDTTDFQNEYLMSTILGKIKGEAANNLATSTITSWDDVKQALLNSFGDKRDCYTLGMELTEMKQNGDTPFEYYNKIQDMLHLQISYVNNNKADKATVLCEYFREYALRVFLKGLKEPLGTLMRTKSPKDLNAALSMLTNDFNIESTIRGQHIQQKQIQHSKPKPLPPPQKYLPQRNAPHLTYRPIPNNSAQQSSYRPFPNNPPQHRSPLNQTNVFRPNNNQRFPNPTPMSISTRQSGPFNNTQQYRPLQQARRPDFTFQELHNTEVHDINIDEQIYNVEEPNDIENDQNYDNNVEYEQTYDPNSFLAIEASDNQ